MSRRHPTLLEKLDAAAAEFDANPVLYGSYAGAVAFGILIGLALSIVLA